MGAILGWCVAAILALGTWLVWWRSARDWRHLEHLLEELANGRKPEGFVFRHGGRFARLTYPLEKIAREQEKLHREIHPREHGGRRDGRGRTSHSAPGESVVRGAV
jgi:hypothetical protein